MLKWPSVTVTNSTENGVTTDHCERSVTGAQKNHSVHGPTSRDGGHRHRRFGQTQTLAGLQFAAFQHQQLAETGSQAAALRVALDRMEWKQNAVDFIALERDNGGDDFNWFDKQAAYPIVSDL